MKKTVCHAHQSQPDLLESGAYQRVKQKQRRRAETEGAEAVQKAKEFISQRIIIDPATACWVWALSCDKKGYGNTLKWGEQKAHRFAYRVWIGPIPKGMLVCHTCDNPPCVNPEHLFVGTNRDNMLDASRKGRICGENHHLSKLTMAQVAQIRASTLTNRVLGELYGVDDSTICRAKTGERYKAYPASSKSIDTSSVR